MENSNIGGFLPLVHDLSNIDQPVGSGSNGSEESRVLEVNKIDIKTDKSSVSPTGVNLTTLPEHKVSSVDLRNEILRLGGDHDDGPEIIDISMWTQNRPSTSSSSHQQRPSINLQESFTASLYDAAASPNDSHSESDSEPDEIPFVSDNTAPPDITSETINVRPYDASGPIVRSNSIMPQAIILLEGSPSLQNLPSYLYDHLAAYCQRKGTDHPEFIKTKWPRSNVHHSANGHSTWFETPQGQRPLLAARYKYGQNSQFLVVQDDATQGWNGGNAAIVVHNQSRISHREINGVPCALHQWFIWDPFGNSSQPLWCWRVISQASSHASRIKPPSASSSQKASSADSRSPRLDHSKREQTSRSNQILRGEEALDAMRGIKRSSSAMDSETPAKKIRVTAANAKRILAMVDRPSPSHVGARRDEASGEIWLRRKSDGRIVVLRCSKCASTVFNTQQGLYNHLNTFHDIRLKDRAEVAEYCGIPVDEMALRMGEPVALGKSTSTDKPKIKSAIGSSSHARPSQRPPQRIATPPPSVELHDSSSPEAQFIFLKTPDDPNPRTRSLSAVSTVEKLFVNALVAGVARKDTLILTITIEKAEPFHVVKGDKEDFGLILERISESRYKNPAVTVTSEDWD